MMIDRMRAWTFVHKWSSLAFTAVLLLACLSGLSLVFSSEIGRWLDPGLPYAALAADAPRADIDAMVEESLRRHPREIVTAVFVDDDEPQVLVWMAPSWAAANGDPDSTHAVKFDARTARLLYDAAPVRKHALQFMEIVRRLHTDLFLALPGELLLAAFAIVFVLALVSFVVLYGPFMKDTVVQARLATRGAVALPSSEALLAPQAAFGAARGALPDMRVVSVVCPGLARRHAFSLCVLDPWR